MEDFDRRRNTAAAVAETVSGKGGGKGNPLRELAEEMKEQIRAGGLREKAAAFYESITASTHFDTASQAKAREAEAGRVKEEAQACLLQIEKTVKHFVPGKILPPPCKSI